MPLKFFTCWTSEPEKRASFIIHDWGRGKDRAGEVPVGHIEARQPLFTMAPNWPVHQCHGTGSFLPRPKLQDLYVGFFIPQNSPHHCTPPRRHWWSWDQFGAIVYVFYVKNVVYFNSFPCSKWILKYMSQALTNHFFNWYL